MATNVLSPTGLVWSRAYGGYQSNAQANIRYIKKGYATAIGLGDIVMAGTGGNQGYMILGTFGASAATGVFAGVLPYFDLTMQQTAHGLNGSWPTTANPAADVPCRVYTSGQDVFRAQASGGVFTNTMIGNNINWVTGTNGAPNGAGVSTLTLDITSVATTNTLPFRIVGVAGVSGGPQDPANTNPVLEVVFNPALLEILQSTGI